MKKFIFYLIGVLITIQANSQKRYISTDPIYISNIDTADSLFEKNQFEQAVPHYQKAMELEDYSFRSKFRLAICLFEGTSKNGNNWLEKCAKQNWEYLCEKEENEYVQQLEKYTDLINWEKLDQTCEEQLSKIDSPLIKILTEIDRFDQGIRRSDLTDADYEASEFYSKDMGFGEIDSINLARMEKIFDQYGYPGKDLVGRNLSYTGFLVIQHADGDVEAQQRYYNLLKDAVDNHQTAKYTIAYLTDRINVNRGKCQVYGSQMGYDDETGNYFIQPIKDIENVNKRRMEYQMRPLEDYISGWGLTLEDAKECKE